MMRDFPEPDYHISVVHGQMKADDKDWEMQRFVRGETHIMIATTVIEVGVNVPNASGDGAAAPRYIEARLSKFALDVQPAGSRRQIVRQV
jgi:late competence protein required for DNA uptake (superfamily II DNA/RNA helicase)